MLYKEVLDYLLQMNYSLCLAQWSASEHGRVKDEVYDHLMLYGAKVPPIDTCRESLELPAPRPKV
jgi:hypothetical protein